MKNNPFLTFLLLVAVQIILCVYLDYADFDIEINSDFALALFFFVIPVICILINFFTENYPFRKAFRYFTIFLVIVSVIGFAGMWYMSGLAKAFQH